VVQLNLKAKHPSYEGALPDWELMRHSYEGERRIKMETFKYLPPTNGMRVDGLAFKQLGWECYQDYIMRAVYYDLLRDAVNAMLGMMHRKKPTIEVPAKLEPMLKRATVNNESLETLLVKMNEQQLVTGRFGLLLDAPTGLDAAKALPFISTYCTDSMFNWNQTVQDEGVAELEFVVLNETGQVINASLEWTNQEKYLLVASSDFLQRTFPDDPVVMALPPKTYVAGRAIGGSTLDMGSLKPPSIAGNTLEHVPFVFLGSRDLVPEPDHPPLLGLARTALSIYRTEADYRQALYMQAQDTLVVIGQTQESKKPGEGGNRLGARGMISLPKGGDAKYIGAQSDGISDLQQAIMDGMTHATHQGANMLDIKSGQAESGDALNIRVGSRTATLGSIARSGAQALEKILQAAAEWVGADPEDVEVEANEDFAEATATPKDLLDYMSAKMLGAPAAKKTIHAFMQSSGLTKMTFEEEQDAIEEEGPVDDNLPPALLVQDKTRGVPGLPPGEEGDDPAAKGSAAKKPPAKAAKGKKGAKPPPKK